MTVSINICHSVVHIPKINWRVIYNIYMSFIRLILEYGNVIWDNCTQNEFNLLESVQVEAGRVITGLRVAI
jgi:ABC-type sulfate transport system permease subunit